MGKLKLALLVPKTTPTPVFGDNGSPLGDVGSPLAFQMSLPCGFCKWMYLCAESAHRPPPPPTQLAGFPLEEECDFSLHGFGLPGAYKLWQVLGKLWRFLLEWFFARGLERKPHGLQESLPGVGFSSGWGRLSKGIGQAQTPYCAAMTG